MNYILKILDKIFEKYRNLIILCWGVIAVIFMYIVIMGVLSITSRIQIIDTSFIYKQVEKIRFNRADFKESDIPVINMICNDTEDFALQRQCQIINNYISEGIEEERKAK